MTTPIVVLFLVVAVMAFRADLGRIGWIWPVRPAISREALELAKSLRAHVEARAPVNVNGPPAFLETAITEAVHVEPNARPSTATETDSSVVPAYVRRGKVVHFVTHTCHNGEIVELDAFELDKQLASDAAARAADEAKQIADALDAEEVERAEQANLLEAHLRSEAADRKRLARNERRRKPRAERAEAK